MGTNGSTSVTFNKAFFDRIMRTAQVERLAKDTAEKALRVARDTAPYDSGAYRDHLELERHRSAYRDSFRVVGRDPKTMLIEAKTGHLARSLKAVGKR